MASIQLKRVRVSEKNGMASFKYNTLRGNGTVYFDKKMFVEGQIPETVTIEAEGLATPSEPAPRKAKSEGTEGAEAVEGVAETAGVAAE